MKSLISKISIFAIIVCSVTFVSCNNKVSSTSISLVPQIGQMRSICELAVMECYYNNIAKYYEEDATGFLFWKKDKDFWVEYSGRVKIGVDISLVELSVSDNIVTITLPPAKVLSSEVDENTLTFDSVVIATKSATIEAADQVNALAEAQVRIEEQISQNHNLLTSALLRVEELLIDYVNSIGDLVGTEYQVKFVYL